MTTSVTSLRNPIDDLTSQLNQPPTKPVGTIEEQLTRQRERGARAEELRPEVMKESLGGIESAMTDLQAKREKGAQDYGTMLERQAKDTAALEEKYTAMRPEPIEFAPTQQTPEQLQTIAVSMMLIGALAGGSAKRSGIAGLKAMKGMVDGYRQGRKDVFDREKTIFEKALDTQRQKLEEVKALYDSALRAQSAGQTAEANKFKALLEAEIQGGSMYVDIAKGRYDASNKMFDAATKAGGEATKSLIEINKAIEDRKLKQQELQIRQQERSDARAERAELAKQRFILSLAQFDQKVDKDREAAQKLGPTEKKELRGIENLRDELVQLQQIALANPEKFFGFGTDLAGNVVAQYREKALKDPEMSSFLRRFEAFQIPERHEKFGATLMGKEQESWRRSIIGPGNDPSAIPEYFTTKLQILDQARNRILSSVPSASTLPTTQQRLSNAAQRAADMGVNVGGIGTGVPRLPQQPQPQPQAIPAAAIDYLKRNPNAKADFDAKYGAGAADRYLSGAR
jgi:hypothetical protein